MTKPLSVQEEASYRELVAEMDALRELPDLDYVQAQRWASLAGTRLALYNEAKGSWEHMAVPSAVGDRWRLVPMPEGVR